MRLVARMTATTALLGLAVFGGYGAWLVARERADLRQAVEREVGFLGTSLRVGLENALRDRQIADVEEASLRLEGVDAPLDVYVFDPQGAPVAAPGGLPSGELREALQRLVRDAARSSEPRLAYVPELRPHALLLATPLLTDDGELQGELGLVRPLDDVNEDLYETSGSVAATVGGFLLLATLVGLVVGQTRLTRPLDGLVRAMRHVRAGDLESTLPETGDEEIAALAGEFNAMRAELKAARRRAEDEAEARREALRTLQAADRLVTLGQLSAAVAHEIGSPLQVLHGRARALAERAEDPERVRKSAEILVRESERIVRIVSQLLTLTRRRPVVRQAVRLGDVAGAVSSLLEIEARRRGVRLELVSEAPVQVEGDPDQLQQVVLNLVRNALAATSEGGRVRIRLGADRDGAHLVVEDDGAGMTEEVRARAFEPLFTTRAELGGAGLGLAVVRTLVDEHGGTVTCTSEPGRGSRFEVLLPLLESRP